ncbi:MAG: Tfp pilus assembly protein FimT/FimU [Planctomycetota bacterium]
MRNPGRTSRGFTLIEIIAVIMIIGIMFTIVILNIDGMIPGEKIKAEARSIGQLLQLARSEAAGKGVNYGIVYDLSKHRYWLLTPVNKEQTYSTEHATEDGKTDKRRQTFYTELPKGIEFKDVQLGAGKDTTIKRGQVRIEISPLGTASGHVVHLIDTKSKQEYSIELNALTALVTYHNNYYDYEELEDFDG